MHLHMVFIFCCWLLLSTDRQPVAEADSSAPSASQPNSSSSSSSQQPLPQSNVVTPPEGNSLQPVSSAELSQLLGSPRISDYGADTEPESSAESVSARVWQVCMQEGLKYGFPLRQSIPVFLRMLATWVWVGFNYDCDMSLGWFQLGLRHEFRLVSTRIATWVWVGFNYDCDMSLGWFQLGLRHEFRLVSTRIATWVWVGFNYDCDMSLGWFQLGLRHEFRLVSTRIATWVWVGFN